MLLMPIFVAVYGARPPREIPTRARGVRQRSSPVDSRIHRTGQNDRIVHPTQMERASKLIRRLPLPGGTLSGEELACAVWPQAVGKKVAGHTRAARMGRTRLIVEVEDVTWQRQLNALSRHIVWNLEQILGKGLVEDLEFRVMPRRREPQRAAEAAPGLFADDAVAIADPVMRSLYRASRKKALA